MVYNINYFMFVFNFCAMKYLLLLLFLLDMLVVSAQVKVSGRVSENRNKPVAGASIVLKNTYDGATSDSSGAYSFTTEEKGAQQLEVSSSGFHNVVQDLEIKSADIVQDISLKEQVTELKAVVISAGSFEASDKNKGAVLSSIDIVTTPSANGDITSAFKSLPGTQQVGESEGLFVRGGTSTETKIYMDGNLVNNFFYSSTPGIASRGRFNPFLFKGTVFSAGGYSALYGQALSSALILESTDLPERTQADFGASVVGIGGGVQHLSKDKKSSWGVSYNYFNLWLGFKLFKQKQDYFQVPEGHQGDANFRIKTKNGGFLKYYGYISTNKTGYRSQDIDSLALKDAFSLDNINTYQNINLKERLGNDWKMQAGISFSTNKDDMSNELQDEENRKIVVTNPEFYQYKNFSLLNVARYAQGRFVLEKRIKGLTAIRFGSDYFYSNEKSTYTLFDSTKHEEVIIDRLYAGFAETDIYVTNGLAAKIGTRIEHSELMQRWNIAPRLSLAYRVGENSQASFAYGIFYQNPERKLLPAAAGIDYSKATHYIFQYTMQTKDRTLRTEIFYKDYDDLFKTAAGNNGRETAVNNNGYGKAKGIEFFWRDKKTIKNVDYWLSYSFLYTKRDFLNYPHAIQPSFATTHTAAFVFKKFILPWKAGINFSYNFATGRPYYNIAYDNNQASYRITDEGKTINYNNMSVSFNYLPSLGKKDTRTFCVWVLGINNVLGQEQIYTYNYSNDGSRKLPVTAPSKRFVFVGCFLSFGIDRTQDAINNNL